MKKHFCVIKGSPFDSKLGETRQWQSLAEEIRKKDSFARASLDAYGLYVQSKDESVIDFAIDTAEMSLLYITEIESGQK